MRPSHLADKSALARADHPDIGARIDPMIEEGTLATCSIVELEMLFSARSPTDYEEIRLDFMLSFPRIDVTQVTLDRATSVQALLARRSAHRGAMIPDLIIAATAEQADLTVLHYDADFDLIAEVTGQPVEWVVPRGSVD